jgi:hypothetical protein
MQVILTPKQRMKVTLPFDFHPGDLPAPGMRNALARTDIRSVTFRDAEDR